MTYPRAGGEGATAREVLRHKSVERCVMVDIDQVSPHPDVDRQTADSRSSETQPAIDRASM